MNKFMSEALNEAYEGIKNHHGGPFGSVVVKDGEIIGRGHNCVLREHDPTLHGEIQAIRNACKNIGSHDLSGCELYTTAQPCPMCLGAIMWAGIDKVYYGCNINDTEKIGFRDEVFYKMLDSDKLGENLICINRDECLKLFADYDGQEDKELY